MEISSDQTRNAKTSQVVAENLCAVAFTGNHHSIILG